MGVTGGHLDSDLAHLGFIGAHGDSDLARQDSDLVHWGSSALIGTQIWLIGAHRDSDLAHQGSMGLHNSYKIYKPLFL